MASFSERCGHRPPEPPITNRDGAPKSYRGALMMLGNEKLGAHQLRGKHCPAALLALAR